VSDENNKNHLSIEEIEQIDWLYRTANKYKSDLNPRLLDNEGNKSGAGLSVEGGGAGMLLDWADLSGVSIGMQYSIEDRVAEINPYASEIELNDLTNGLQGLLEEFSDLKLIPKYLSEKNDYYSHMERLIVQREIFEKLISNYNDSYDVKKAISVTKKYLSEEGLETFKDSRIHGSVNKIPFGGKFYNSRTHHNFSYSNPRDLEFDLPTKKLNFDGGQSKEILGQDEGEGESRKVPGGRMSNIPLHAERSVGLSSHVPHIAKENPFNLKTPQLKQQAELLERNPARARQLIVAAGRDPVKFGLSSKSRFA